MASKLQFRKDTTANWAFSNPILSEGEPGVDLDTGGLKVGDGVTAWSALGWASGGAVIDDNETDSTAAWSAEKVQEQIDASAIGDTTTPVAVMSATTVTGNNGDDVELTIQNYNAGNAYLVWSDDQAVATIARTNAAVTVSLPDVSGNQTTNVHINVYNGSFTFDSTVTLPVTNYDVDPVDADDLVQITDFLTNVDASGNSDFSYTNGITADVDGAYYRAEHFTQEQLDSDWVTHTVKVTVADVEDSVPLMYAGAGTATAQRYYLDGDFPNFAEFLLVDDVGNEFSITATENIATPGDYTNIEDITVLNTGTFNNVMYGGAMSGDGTTFFSCGSGYTIRYATAATPYDPSTLGTVNGFTLPSTGMAQNTLIAIWISADGTKLFGMDRYWYSSSYPFLARWDLSTPNDLSTATFHSALNNSTLTYKPYTQTARMNFSLSDDGYNIYYVLGDEYVSGGTSSLIVQLTLNTAFDLSSVNTQFGSANALYNYNDFQISHDGKTALVLLYADNGGAYYRHALHRLSIPFDLSTFDSTSYQTFDSAIEPNAYGYFASRDGKHVYTYGLVTDQFQHKELAAPISTGPSHYELDESVVTNPIVKHYRKPVPPTVKVEAQMDSAYLNPLNADLIAFASEPAGLYNPSGGVISREFTYTKTSKTCRHIQPIIEADEGANITKLVIELEKAGVVGAAPPVVGGGDISVTDFSLVEQSNNGWTHRT